MDYLVIVKPAQLPQRGADDALQFAGIFGLDMQDIGAQQTGVTKDEFKAKLVAANDQ